jgi:hypothetical protein
MHWYEILWIAVTVLVLDRFVTWLWTCEEAPPELTPQDIKSHLSGRFFEFEPGKVWAFEENDKSTLTIRQAKKYVGDEWAIDVIVYGVNGGATILATLRLYYDMEVSGLWTLLRLERIGSLFIKEVGATGENGS